MEQKKEGNSQTKDTDKEFLRETLRKNQMETLDMKDSINQITVENIWIKSSKRRREIVGWGIITSIIHTVNNQSKYIHSFQELWGMTKGKKSKSLRCRSTQNLGSEIEAVNFKVQGKIQPSKYRGTQTLNTHPQRRPFCVTLQLAWNRTAHTAGPRYSQRWAQH